MDATRHACSTPQDWLFDSGLASQMDSFTEVLTQGRYSAQTRKKYVASIAHFARWMVQCRLQIEHVSDAAVRSFLDHHLRRCKCPGWAPRCPGDLHAACRLLLRLLRERGVIAKPSVAQGPIEDELRRFDGHMRRARGLCPKTRLGRLRIVRRLLLVRFAARPVVIAALQASDVRRFIAAQLEHCSSASNASTIASALRAYFRFRASGGDRVHALLGAISTPAHWNLASLPRSLSDEEIDHLLASFTPQLRSYRRGYAMVRCALDMGLRASEIAKLALADIDWRSGTVRLRSTKSRREDLVPLPIATGRALAEYLRFERPPTSNPAVFVRRQAPRDAAIGPDAVRRVVRDAYSRIGLTHGRTHALRHSLAGRLLEHGSSLKEVADVLRHRSLNTTLIYAKLDQPRLLAVALPWPGSVS